MLDRIRKWWAASREWQREHNQTFAEAGAADADGVTVFQRRLMAAVGSFVAENSFRRMSSKDGTVYFVGDVSGTPIQLFVYPTEAGLANVPKRGGAARDWWPYEEWDFRTPDELIDAVITDLKGVNAV